MSDSRNPYDRRRGPRDRGLRAGSDFSSGFGSMPPPRALAIEDLDALAHSAHLRGQEAMNDRLSRAHVNDLQTVRRETWAEGHDVGAADGREKARQELVDKYGAEMNELLAVATGQHAKAGTDLRKVTRRDLAHTVARAESLLLKLMFSLHMLPTQTDGERR
jgi:hypothetical protein